MTIAHLNHIILGLGIYFYPVNTLSNKKRAMHHGTRNPCELKVRCYADCLININEYLASFIWAKEIENIGEA